MFGYDRIGASGGTGTIKTGGSCECIICQFCFFQKINFRFQPKWCNGCHDMKQKYMTFNVVIVTVGRNYHRIHFWSMTKSEAVKRMKNADLRKKTDNYDYEKNTMK